MDWKSLIVPGLVGLLSTLVMGSFLRKVILLLLKYFADRSDNKLDDELVSTIQHDWKVNDLEVDGKDNSDGK